MAAIRSFVRREPVLLIAALAALISCFFVPPDAGYASYLDFRTLALLYCLMTVVAGLRQAGLFAHLAHTLCEKAGSVRAIGLLLVLLSFFAAMLITNDVALLTFVPFAVVVLGMADRTQDLIRIVVLQTVAANLGSMLTPVGNPQNLYLYSFYNYDFLPFLRVTLPYWLLSFGLIAAACVLLPLVLKSGIHLSGADFCLLLFLGVITTALAHTLFISSLSDLPAQLAGVCSSMETVYGILFAFLLLGEVPSLREIAGAAIIISAVAAAQLLAGAPGPQRPAAARSRRRLRK